MLRLPVYAFATAAVLLKQPVPTPETITVTRATLDNDLQRFWRWAGRDVQQLDACATLMSVLF